MNRSNGIRVGELLHPDHLRQRLRYIVPRKNTIHKALSGDAKVFDADVLCDEYLGYAKHMSRHIADTTVLLHQALKQNKRLLFEGAQGSLLDIDHGTYPFVTSSNSSTAGIWPGSGVPARNLTRIIGVIKAYSTRVGRGPFPTELDDGPTGLGERIRQTGREFGTVTGRPRRCGWFDAVAVRHTARVGGIDELAVMLVDVLSVVDELRICTSYELKGDKLDYFPTDSFLLEKCRPLYETMPGWKVDVTKARTMAELPDAARRYLDRLSAYRTTDHHRLSGAGPRADNSGEVTESKGNTWVAGSGGASEGHEHAPYRAFGGALRPGHLLKRLVLYRALNQRTERNCMAVSTLKPDALQRIADAGLDPARLPRHVAIIMDGNGRWARQRGLPRIEGHRRGVMSVRDD